MSAIVNGGVPGIMRATSAAAFRELLHAFDIDRDASGRADRSRERHAAFDLAALLGAASRSRSAGSSMRNSSGSLTVTSR